MPDATYQLSEYEKLRIERIKNNHVRLKQLGLDKSFASHCPKPVTTRRPKTKKWVVKSGQERRSPRLKRISEAGTVDETVDKDHVIFSYDSDDFIEDESKPASRSRSLKWIDFQISKEELEALEKNIDGNYLEKFRVSFSFFRLYLIEWMKPLSIDYEMVVLGVLGVQEQD